MFTDATSVLGRELIAKMFNKYLRMNERIVELNDEVGEDVQGAEVCKNSGVEG